MQLRPRRWWGVPCFYTHTRTRTRARAHTLAHPLTHTHAHGQEHTHTLHAHAHATRMPTRRARSCTGGLGACGCARTGGLARAGCPRRPRRTRARPSTHLTQIRQNGPKTPPRRVLMAFFASLFDAFGIDFLSIFDANLAPTCLPKSRKINEKSLPGPIPILVSLFE